MKARPPLVVAVAIIIVITPVVAVRLQAASYFGSSSFQQTWQTTEATIPNFWGPLNTAHDPQLEAYTGGGSTQPCPPGRSCAQVIAVGQRLVQYFDKARMELNRPDASVTTGLLTVELKTGTVQTGDNTYEQRQPANINIAGDPGMDGLTYAALRLVPERVAQNPLIETVSPLGYDKKTGQFSPAQNIPISGIPISPDPFYGPYLQDPGGRYGQYVFKPFYDFIMALPVPLDKTTGYPISPVILAQVNVGGLPTYVLIQAFERRVLTFTGANLPESRVEFGNIGQHYFSWRYGNAP